MSQLKLSITKTNKWGGARKGSGRKKKNKQLQTHKTRETFKSNHPLHITLKLKKNLPNLRQKKYFKIFRKAVLKSRRMGLRIIHFSVQSNHLHLLIESSDKQKLALGMQSFTISFAKSINGILKRSGGLFKDRYHLHILKTPIEVKRALVYIFQNWAKHTRKKWRFDPYSSLLGFSKKIELGLSMVNTHAVFKTKSQREHYQILLLGLITHPETWLLTQGWKKASKIRSYNNVNF